MRRRLLAIMGLCVLVQALAASPALAATPLSAPLAVLGIDFPSVKSIVADVVRFFFSTFLDALVPDWLKTSSVDVIKRLVTVPNPTDARVWPTLGRLSEGMRWIAVPLLSLAAVAAWAQQWLREMTNRPSSLETVLPRTVLAALLLVSYPTFLANAVALVNSITNAMLSQPAVAQGLERTVGLVFAGTLVSGSGLLLALLGIAAVLLAVGLFLLSVGLLVLFGILFVAAPLAIACSVVEDTQGVWAAWRYTLLTAALVPIGWCVLFATSGAFMLDMTTWSGGIGGTLGSRLVGVFGALITLWLAIRWPLMLWGKIKLLIGGALLTVGGSGQASRSSGQAPGGARAARAALQRGSVRAAERLGGGLASARQSAGGSARTALGAATSGLARVADAHPALAAVASAAGTATSPARERAQQVGASVRSRTHDATETAKATLVHGGSSRDAATAALAVATRPANPDRPPSGDQPDTAPPGRRRSGRPQPPRRADRTSTTRRAGQASAQRDRAASTATRDRAVPERAPASSRTAEPPAIRAAARREPERRALKDPAPGSQRPEAPAPPAPRPSSAAPARRAADPPKPKER